MALTILHTMSNSQFENKESLRNTSKQILERQGASKETIDKIINQPIFNNKINQNNQLMHMNTVSYLIMQESIKETAKYLKGSKPNKKSYVFGELRQLFELNSEKDLQIENLDIEIDLSAKNIFIAA